MLTLTREVGEKIVIGEDIVITVVSVSENGRVRLGIEAPRQVRIDRSEVLERVRKENLEAASACESAPTDHRAWAKYAAQKANERASTKADATEAERPAPTR